MKNNIFNEYAGKVLDLFQITEKELFAKSRKTRHVDARYFLYYLCYHRPMKIHYIQEYMKDNGYDVGHSSIIHGISRVEKKITEDADIKNIIKDIA
jgi:chromosomal replication initiation ATPase DnaA|tara:strand:+ start:167 stop:454 length:288 start_codon:yes stop_codon:yes gene_type:complete